MNFYYYSKYNGKSTIEQLRRVTFFCFLLLVISYCLINHHCEGCPFRSRCTKSRIGRSINYCKELDEFHKEVRKNVTSEEGKKLMFKRDNEAEGTFGDLKENMGYDRLYRRGHDNVQMEIYLVSMGHNIRKYQKLKKKIKETEENQMKQVEEMLRLFIC